MNLWKSWWYLRTQVLRCIHGKIGKHSYVAPTLFIQRRKNVYIGNNVRIYPGMRAELTTKSA